MANDRVHLRCKTCGASVTLAKHMASDWYVGNSFPAGVEEFIRQHGDMLHGYTTNESHWEQPFELTYESDADYPRLLTPQQVEVRRQEGIPSQCQDPRYG